MARLDVMVGRTALKNPLIAGAAEHMIGASGVLRALGAGVGAVVVKSINEMERGKDQLQRAEYMLLDDQWREIPWTKDAPSTAFMGRSVGVAYPLASTVPPCCSTIVRVASERCGKGSRRNSVFDESCPARSV